MRLSGFVCALFLVACGGEHVQQAIVRSPTVAATHADPSPNAPSRGGGSGARWLVTPAHTRLEIHGWGPLVGEQVFTFRRFRANVSTSGDSASFRAELATASLEGGLPGVGAFARERLLEVDAYPRATFEGVARRTSGVDACTVTGTLSLHGVTRELVFDGRIEESADSIRFEAAFDLSRQDFDVGLHDAWDAFVPNRVRVVLDVRAEREHVWAEEL
ncbi:MAG TPA: YceI family protein [Labilithrix sp.]